MRREKGSGGEIARLTVEEVECLHSFEFEPVY